jgi:hypothetical protein
MTDLTVFSAMALLIATLYAGQNLIRYARANDWNGALGILLACGLGILVVWLAAQADATSHLKLIEGAQDLGHINGASLVMLGVGVGSGGTVLHDLKSAFDNNDTAKKPALVPPQNSGE